MDERLYREFDGRAHFFFSNVMHGVTDKEHPPRKYLLTHFIQEVRRGLPLSSHDERRLVKVFNFSFRAHLDTPKRKSGEAYFFHLFRAALVEAWIQEACGVYDLRVIEVVLLHDCYEEARGLFHSRLLIRTRVQLRFGYETSYDVHTLTKHKEREETNEEYCERLPRCDRWRPLAAKFVDRDDNMFTINAMVKEKRDRKIAETVRYFPAIGDRLMLLLEREVDARRLKGSHRAWFRYGRFHIEYLWYAVAEKKRELDMA